MIDKKDSKGKVFAYNDILKMEKEKKDGGIRREK